MVTDASPREQERTSQNVKRRKTAAVKTKRGRKPGHGHVRDGTLEQFKDRKGYQVLTLIAGDGVHPSNPIEFRNDFSAEALRTSGYTLRNYLVLRSYAAVIRNLKSE